MTHPNPAVAADQADMLSRDQQDRALAVRHSEAHATQEEAKGSAIAAEGHRSIQLALATQRLSWAGVAVLAAVAVRVVRR